MTSPSLPSVIVKSCFVLRKLDKLDKVADQIDGWKENMPALFENGWGDGEGKICFAVTSLLSLICSPGWHHGSLMMDWQ